MQLKLIVIIYCQFTIHNNDNTIIMEDSYNNQKKNIFRLSAILYSKTNNVVSNKSIVRKVGQYKFSWDKFLLTRSVAVRGRLEKPCSKSEKTVLKPTIVDAFFSYKVAQLSFVQFWQKNFYIIHFLVCHRSIYYLWQSICPSLSSLHK